MIAPLISHEQTLGAIAKKLEIVGSFLAAIEQRPAITSTFFKIHMASLTDSGSIVPALVHQVGHSRQ